MKTVHQPTGETQALREGIRPEKSAEQQPQLPGRQMKFVLDIGRPDGEVGPVDIVDEARGD